VPQIATVGLVGGFRDDGGIETQEEPDTGKKWSDGVMD
jgi:hypothetical protein